MLIAEINQGHVDAADVLFLVAFIIFVVVAVLRFARRSYEGGFMAAGAACLALAWFVL